MNENKTENNWDTLYKVIEECPDDICPGMKKYIDNEELDDSKKVTLNKESNMGLDDEEE